VKCMICGGDHAREQYCNLALGLIRRAVSDSAQAFADAKKRAAEINREYSVEFEREGVD